MLKEFALFVILLVSSQRIARKQVMLRFVLPVQMQMVISTLLIIKFCMDHVFKKGQHSVIAMVFYK